MRYWTIFSLGLITEKKISHVTATYTMYTDTLYTSVWIRT